METSIFLSPADQISPEQTVGTTLEIEVLIDDVTDLFGWQLSINYDPNVLMAIGFDLAFSPWQEAVLTGKGFATNQLIDNFAGNILLGFTFARQPGGQLPTFSTVEPALLGTAMFQVLSLTSGTVIHLETYSEDPGFGIILVDPGIALIPYSTLDATFANLPVTLQVGIEIWVTDGSFNRIDSFRAVFRPDRTTGSFVLVATNPGTLYLNILVNASGTVTYALDPSFRLKGADPIHVYADMGRTMDITNQTILGENEVSVDSLPPSGIIYVTIHLEYALRGASYTRDDVAAWDMVHSFRAEMSSVSSSVEVLSLRKVMGDVNRDLNIDILDAALVAYAYGASAGSSRFDTASDLNEDGVVDIMDAAIVAFYFSA